MLTDTRTRTHELLRLIAARVLNGSTQVFTDTDTDTDTLFLTEAIARRYRILPLLPSDDPDPIPMATVVKSIGTTGRDYSTITAWEADLDSGALYASGDTAVGECYDDSAFDESVTIDGGGTVGLAAVTLTVASGQRHDGTAGTGSRVVSTTTAKTLTISRAGNTVSWLEWDCNSLGSATVNVLTNSLPGSVDHILLHGASAARVRGILNSHSLDLTNSIIYHLVGTTTNNTHGVIEQSADTRTVRVANVTIHDMQTTTAGIFGFNNTDVDASATKQINNCLVTGMVSSGGGSVACFSVTGYGSISHNASSDATASGTGSLTSITTANQYVSTVVGSEDLHLKSGADCINAGTDLGTTPTGVNLDIDGYDRDATGVVWDIGADEFVAVGGSALLKMTQAYFATR